ncbi:MAG: L-rhamnose mutarotase [Pirellulales bacterium]|nr:L-rhamnose mutarotase [Pirellulales bacterium]
MGLHINRLAFRVQLNRVMPEDCRRRHDEVRPAMDPALREAGLVDYAFWQYESTGVLFA